VDTGPQYTPAAGVAEWHFLTAVDQHPPTPQPRMTAITAILLPQQVQAITSRS
jgi:hypothetical protein